MKTICVVTASRSEYGILRPVMRAIEASELLTLQLVVTGMHLEAADRFGLTVQEIEKDGFHIGERFPLAPATDTPQAMGRAVGGGIVRFIDAFERLDPDVVLVLGDRTEMFAASVAAVFCGKCLAHIHGGDRSRGGFDESMRHAITKLAHVHFAATEKSAERIRRMGECPEHVHVVGAPGLDEIVSGPFLSREELAAATGFPLDPAPVVVVQHPVSTAPQNAAAEMKETLEAATSVERPVIVVMPNNDAGASGIAEVVKSYRDAGKIVCAPSVARTQFIGLLKHAGVLVGNSSSGIIEAASFGLPVVNVGERQRGREHGANVIDVAASRDDIRTAIRKCLMDQEFRSQLAAMTNPYGRGNAGELIAGWLEALEITHDLLQKQIAY